MTTSWRGTYTVMVTAFDEVGRVDLSAQARFTEWQIRSGIHGLIPLGSTGEFLSLDQEEYRAVAKCVIDTAAGQVPVIVGTGAERTEDVIEKSKMAEGLGADGVMVIPPFYSTPTDAELIAHYERIAGSVSIPIMLYNNPATANVDLTPPLVAKLAKIDRVDYIKESTMDVTRVRDIIDFCGPKMKVFGGIMGYESFLEGAVGWVAVGSNLMPREFSELFTATADDEDLQKARSLYKKVLPIIRLVGGHRYVSATKAGLAEIGQPMGAPRSPRLPLPTEERHLVTEALNAAGALAPQAA